MKEAPAGSSLQQRLHDALFVEAMLLADEARAYFDDRGRAERETLASMARVLFSCESLKVTTRLMQVIAWLLTQRAVLAGELQPDDRLSSARRLGDAPVTLSEALAEIPEVACKLVEASIDLHCRVARMERAQQPDVRSVSPARLIQERLALAI